MIIRKKILYIDMDGVLADFDSAKAESLFKHPKIEYPQSQYGFFRNLKPISGAIQAVQLLRSKFDIYILTSSSIKNPLCYTEKMLWIQDNFDDEMVKRLIISKHKHLNKGDFLIDDRLMNGADKFEGELIHFGWDYEKGVMNPFPNWVEVLAYLEHKK